MAQLTLSQKRVAIARDVIKQIAAKRIFISSGEYLSGRHDDIDLNQKNINEVKPCQVCQIGSAIVSGIRLFNQVSIPFNLGANDSKAMNLVTTWFTKKTAVMMEGAFEGGGGWLTRHYVKLSDKELEAAINFYVKHKGDETKRSIAIWRNVIKNKGHFKP